MKTHSNGWPIQKRYLKPAAEETPTPSTPVEHTKAAALRIGPLPTAGASAAQACSEALNYGGKHPGTRRLGLALDGTPVVPATHAEPVTIKDALRIGTELGIDWNVVDADQFRRGLDIEAEHGPSSARTDVTGGDERLTGKIAWAHLLEIPDYYTRLEKLEAEAKAYWTARR